MPTHNRAREVTRAAASVLSQDVEELELVIVDDCSTDDTAHTLERLSSQDRRVRIVQTASPAGPCVTRNVGLAKAEGDVVAFCDDDDAWLPGVGRELVEYLDAHRDVAAVSTWHLVVHADSGGAAVFRGPLEFTDRQLLWQNFVALPFAMIRRSALSFDVNFDPELPTGEDWDLWLRCSKDGPVRTLPRVGYAYTQHSRTRVTRTASAQAIGRRNFVTKYAADMTPACRLLHETILAGLETGRAGALRHLVPGEGRPPADCGYVAALLATSVVASRIGIRRHDPGFQSRVICSLLGRSPRR
jgi:glycosyltransferase involved in cell wall biosynthesis